MQDRQLLKGIEWAKRIGATKDRRKRGEREKSLNDDKNVTTT